MRAPSSGIPRRELGILILVAFGVALLVGALLQFNDLALNNASAGGEFLLLWTGSRAVLFENTDPYGVEVPRQVQAVVYGRRARPGEQPYFLTVPFNLLLVFFPFGLIPHAQTARAAFTLFCEFVLIALVAFGLSLADWRPKLLLVLLFAAVCAFNYSGFQALAEGSLAPLLGALYAGILLSLDRGRYELAGALLVLSTVHWEIGAPFLLLVAARATRLRRGPVLAGAGMLGVLLLAISLLLYPGWLFPFLRAVANNLRAEYGYASGHVFAGLFPGAGTALGPLLVGLLVLLLLAEGRAALSAENPRFYWAACVTLAATPLLGQRIEMENLVVLILPWALLLRAVHERWRRHGDRLVIALMLALLAGPWLLATAGSGVFGQRAEGMILLFLPLLTVIGLYWMRWWALSPPRTWADAVAAS